MKRFEPTMFIARARTIQITGELIWVLVDASDINLSMHLAYGGSIRN
jgi:hypothetical protein